MNTTVFIIVYEGDSETEVKDVFFDNYDQACLAANNFAEEHVRTMNEDDNHACEFTYEFDNGVASVYELERTWKSWHCNYEVRELHRGKN